MARGSAHPERGEEGEYRSGLSVNRTCEAIGTCAYCCLFQVLTPSARNYGDIIAGAVEHGDAATAWALYEELIGKGLSPHEETWDALFKRRSISQPDDEDKLLQILLYMRDNQIYPGHSLASTIKTWFERCRRLESVFQSTLVGIKTLNLLSCF